MAEAMAPEAADAEVAGQILGISRTAFKEGVARTTIRLYEGATPLTLIEEKLEGDASVMMRSPGKRAWLLEALRDVERKTGSTLFRTGDDAQVTDNDIKEAWSHLGQGYFVGRSKKGDDQMLAGWKEKGFRQVYADILSSKAGPAMQAYGTFFRSVWRRGAELNQMRRAGTLDADLEGALRRSLGMSDGKSALLTDDQSITQGTVNNRAQAGIELKPGQKLREEDGVSFAVTPVPFADNVEAAVRGKLAANAILDMGRPGEVLRKAGVPDLPMWLRLSKVRKKRGKHSELTEEVLKKFPEAMDNPMLVYVSPRDRKAHSIVTSLATSQGPLTAYFTVHEREGQQVLEAKTLFGKEPGELLAEIHEAERLGLITHKNKGAFEAWLAQGDGTLDGTSTQHGPAIEGLKRIFHEAEENQPNSLGSAEDGSNSLNSTAPGENSDGEVSLSLLSPSGWLDQAAKSAGYSDAEALKGQNKQLYDRLQAQWDAYHGANAEKKRSQDIAINDIDNLLYGTSQHPPTPSRRPSSGHSRGEARTRLETAREDYRRSFGSSAPPAGSPAGGGAEARAAQRKRERAWLVDWAREHGLLIHTLPPAWKPGGPDDAGQMEHHVFHVGSRWVKITGGTGEHFGLWPVPHQGEWDMRKEDASILNYLNSMANANKVFGDDMVIQGVLAERDGSVKLIISQPDIAGDFADTKFIGKAMAEMGFVQLEPPSSFYRPSDNTAVIDLHQENAARIDDLILPFDVKVLHPTGTLRENLERAAENKRKGNREP